jgi:hypothetical protein
MSAVRSVVGLVGAVFAGLVATVSSVMLLDVAVLGPVARLLGASGQPADAAGPAIAPTSVSILGLGLGFAAAVAGGWVAVWIARRFSAAAILGILLALGGVISLAARLSGSVPVPAGMVLPPVWHDAWLPGLALLGAVVGGALRRRRCRGVDSRPGGVGAGI